MFCETYSSPTKCLPSDHREVASIRKRQKKRAITQQTACTKRFKRQGSLLEDVIQTDIHMEMVRILFCEVGIEKNKGADFRRTMRNLYLASKTTNAFLSRVCLRRVWSINMEIEVPLITAAKWGRREKIYNMPVDSGSFAYPPDKQKYDPLEMMGVIPTEVVDSVCGALTEATNTDSNVIRWRRDLRGLIHYPHDPIMLKVFELDKSIPRSKCNHCHMCSVLLDHSPTCRCFDQAIIENIERVVSYICEWQQLASFIHKRVCVGIQQASRQTKHDMAYLEFGTSFKCCMVDIVDFDVGGELIRTCNHRHNVFKCDRETHSTKMFFVDEDESGFPMWHRQWMTPKQHNISLSKKHLALLSMAKCE